MNERTYDADARYHRRVNVHQIPWPFIERYITQRDYVRHIHRLGKTLSDLKVITLQRAVPLIKTESVIRGRDVQGKHPESGGARREITCWHQAEGRNSTPNAEDSDAWCHQLIFRLAPPDEQVFSFYTVLLLLLWRRISEIFRSAFELRDTPCSTTW